MFVFCQERLCYKLIRSNYESRIYESCVRQVSLLIQLNLVIRNVLIRNKLVLRNHFPWPNANLLHKDKEHLALRNNFRVTKKFLITKFDCIILWFHNVVGKSFPSCSWIEYFYFCLSWQRSKNLSKFITKKHFSMKPFDMCWKGKGPK